jgi:hypothetical protein
MSGMTGLVETAACASCGALANVKRIRVKYEGQWVPQLWCEPCRRAKLVRQSDKAGGARRSTTGLRAGLVVLGALLVTGLVMGALRVLA